MIHNIKQNKNYDVSFLQWLIGFIDAEGNFQVYKKLLKEGRIRLKCSFHIGLSLKDKELLYEIKDFLGMGNIYEYIDRNEAHFAITKKANLHILIDMLDTYSFFTKHQADKYNVFRHCVKYGDYVFSDISDFNSFIQRPINYKNYSEKQFNFFTLSTFVRNKQVFKEEDKFVNYVFKNWICGFITGEGCFHKHINQRVFQFDLEQQEKEVLNFMHQYFSFGPKVAEKKLRLNRKQTYSIKINSKKDLITLINFLEDKSPNFIGLKGYKKSQYISWRDFFYKKIK